MLLNNDLINNISWEKLFDKSNVWWLIVGNTGEIIYSSKNSQQFIGISAEEILNDNKLLLNFISRNHRNKIKNFFQERLINTTDILTIRFKVSISKKTEKWLAAESHPVYFHKENAFKYCFFIKDITWSVEEKHHLKKLNKQQSILVAATQIATSDKPFSSRIDAILEIIGNYTGVSRVYIFEDSQDGLTASNTYEWCNKGIIPQINDLQNIPYSVLPSWRKLLSRDGIIVSSEIKNLPKDIYEFLKVQAIKSILVLPLSFQNFQYGFIGFDECARSRVWQQDEINLLKTISNTITNSFYRNKYKTELELTKLKLQDLLEIKTLELRKNEHYYKALIETQEDLICRWLPDTTLTFVNHSYCNFFNIKESELIGEKWINFVDSDSRPYIESVISDIFITGKPATYEHAIKDCKGELRWYQWIDTPIKKEDGTIIELQSTGRDITDKIQYQAGLIKAKERIEELDKAKLEFLRLVSHELRTPLNAVIGFSELIKTNSDVDQILTFNSYIYKSGITLLRMIEDMLTLTNLQSGNTSLILQEFELIPVLKELRVNFDNNSIKLEKPIFVKLKHSLKPGFKLITDKEKLIFILTKLLDNALIFCDKGTIQFGARIKKDHILFYVKDEGVGISEENQKIIFQDFKKITMKRKSFHEGLGVSLYISKKIVELMGGHIRVDSKINHGSTFYISLPLHKKSKEVKFSLFKTTVNNEQDSIVPDLKNRTILIVEDTESNLKYLVEALKETNSSVLWARNGKECIEIFKTADHIDCVLMDILMPEMDGYEACLQIRKLDKDIPIIAQTAYAMDKEVQLVIDSQNFTDYLLKPVWKYELFRKLKKHLK